jgi:acetate kinase
MVMTMESEQPLIAVVNAGSATLKFSLLSAEQAELKGVIERLGATQGAGPQATFKTADGEIAYSGSIPAHSHEDALTWLFEWLEEEHPSLRESAVGHRVVHGGDGLIAPVLVTPSVIDEIESLIPLAPLHQAHNLGPIRFIAERFPDLPQVACFDTAFHASQAPIERMFALPAQWRNQNIRRYGFHGLSYEYIASRLPEIDVRATAGRTIVCHLGNGASLCAIHAGRSVATTMAFTALEGLPMGTRCGSIDPGVLLHLLDQAKLTVPELTDLLYKRSGLLGLSGISSDMRDLLASQDPQAALAVEYFCYRIAREIGSLTAALGGLDALVFTGGIGEHAPPVRARICELSAWLGIEIDKTANEANGRSLHTHASALRVFVVPTDEERMIARHTTRLIGLGA